MDAFNTFLSLHFNTIAFIWMGLAVVVFILLQFVTAPFGRHTKSTWGPEIDNKYAWILMEAISFSIMLFWFLVGSNSMQLIPGFLMILWLFHYFHRSFIYPFFIRTKNKKMPLIIFLFAVIFNSINAYLNGFYLAELSNYSNAWFGSVYLTIGLPLYFVGVVINVISDYYLISLRKKGGTGYKIPVAGLFKYVSAPNLLGEILEWLGFAFMALNPAAWAFAVWTFANLAPRAKAHHRFYKESFEDYPEDRKALIPFVY